MESMIDAQQVWMLSPELSVVLLGFLVLGLDLLTRRRTLVWATALIGLIVPTLLTFSLSFYWFVRHPPTSLFVTLPALLRSRRVAAVGLVIRVGLIAVPC